MLLLFLAAAAAAAAGGGLSGKTLFGYQCWYGAGGGSYGWRHWSQPPSGPPGNFSRRAVFDYWPSPVYRSSYPSAYSPQLPLYSCEDYSTVLQHVQMLRRYQAGHGLMLQRFLSETEGQRGPAFAFRNLVASHLAKASAAVGTVLVIASRARTCTACTS